MKIEAEYPDEHGPGTGTVSPGEHHPAADNAMEWFRRQRLRNPLSIVLAMETFASTAASGNRTAELCYETMRRLLEGEPVSDRYLLGLCWTLRDMNESDNRCPQCGAATPDQHIKDCPNKAEDSE